ncbi:hypothetical protein Kim5_CH00755 [Rhizobium sp. Kim5]|uniref:hypothetical protein n=1 Tax=Rhizobium sp. Kim5 TaxID=2020311 RepID=UPI000A2A4322|nr:hypothetical protein [Rhizobium sp. Kim5]ARQ56863.1 hypothetical protein Kim5_CH00755 [Rhizobium sp. Kim5]
MASQLSLDVELPERVIDAPNVDIAEAVLQAHGGDAKTAIRELLADADFLRDQLYTASKVMSAGYTRGWKPKYERV